jgi:beta-fructofuranosidase
MTLPRRNSLRKLDYIGYQVTNKPYDITPVLGAQLGSNSSLENGTMAIDYSRVRSNAVYISANVSNIPTANISSYASFNFTFASPISGEYLQGGYYFGNNYDLFINRGGVRGFDDIFFTDKFTASDLASGTWSFEAVFDRSILEVFADEGAYSGTATFFPTRPLTMLMLSANQLSAGMKVSVAVYAIKSAWADYENENGTVMGNVTASGTNARRHAPLAYEAEF